ncbi:MAG: hypothetical protein ACR2F2_11160 [Pyrinomonadaceae bacterium]
MNVFEDLIEELKEENLLEETVTEIQRKKTESGNLYLQKKPPENIRNEKVGNFENAEVLNKSSEFVKEFPQSQLPAPNEIFQPAAFAENIDNRLLIENKPEHIESGDLIPENPQLLTNEFIQQDFTNNFSSDSANQQNQADFYKKRATDEVMSLQMVEHILSGVERDLLHITPKSYDDLEVKKSLHNFMQISQNIDSPEQAQAEFLLLQETESWYSALSQKDKNISVGNLCRYCETTRPVLSPQALAALARFYRNAPFSESVRSKFDLVMTRFFAREMGSDIRKLLLSRDEIIEKLNEFYAEWSSIPLYANEEDESNIVLAAIKLEEFMTEAEETENFDNLIKSDFFKRLKDFKENTHDNFFAPLVIATAVESNIRIGNRFLELLLKEKENSSVESFEEKHGTLQDRIVSDILCKTIRIADIFENKFTEADNSKTIPVEQTQPANSIQLEKQDLNKQSEKSQTSKKQSFLKGSLFNVNKWILAATITAIVGSVGLYLWVEYFNPPLKLPETVKSINLENSSLKDYVQTARLNGDMFYGIITPNWDNMNNEKKEEFLRKIVLVGGDKGFVKVTLMNKQGRTVGYASPEKVEIYNP